MIRKRVVFGEIKRTDGSVWVNATVFIRRLKGSFTSESQFPADSITTRTNNNGYLEVELWCNEDGEISTNYEFITFGDRFNFSLSYGDGSPINLSVLRSTNGSINPPSQTILEYIDDQITQATENVIAGNNISLISPPYSPLVALSALRVINLGTLLYASCDNLNDANSHLGFSRNSVSQGESSSFLISGEISSNFWNWDITKPIFLGFNGFLTQQISLNSSFSKISALAINPQTIFINFGESIIL